MLAKPQHVAIAALISFWRTVRDAVLSSLLTDSSRAPIALAPAPIESERLIRQAKREAYEEVQEYVVLEFFDTTIGRKIDEFCSERIATLGDES
jgi:hypothetical protein